MLRPTAGAVLVAVAALLGPALASGQGPGATRPVFEHVHALTFDAEGRALWLGTHAGLFRSENGGRTWEKVPLLADGSHGPDVMNLTSDR